MFGKLRQLLGIAPAPVQSMGGEIPLNNLDELQMDQATGGRFQNGLRNIQPQSYPVQELYRTQIGQVPARNPQQPRNGAYMTGGGVPTSGNGIYGDANGQEALRRIVRQNLMVR